METWYDVIVNVLHSHTACSRVVSDTPTALSTALSAVFYWIAISCRKLSHIIIVCMQRSWAADWYDFWLEHKSKQSVIEWSLRNMTTEAFEIIAASLTPLYTPGGWAYLLFWFSAIVLEQMCSWGPVHKLCWLSYEPESLSDSDTENVDNMKSSICSPHFTVPHSTTRHQSSCEAFRDMLT